MGGWPGQWRGPAQQPGFVDNPTLQIYTAGHLNGRVAMLAAMSGNVAGAWIIAPAYAGAGSLRGLREGAAFYAHFH